MLDLALKARLPIIAVSTHDVLSVQPTVAHLGKGRAKTYESITIAELRKSPADFLVTLQVDSEHIYDLHAEAKAIGKSIVVVNCDIDDAPIYDAGALPVPKQMIKNLAERILGAKVSAAFVALFGGLSLKEIEETIYITVARDNEMSAAGILATRASYANRLRGLALVSTNMPCYMQDDRIEAWIAVNRKPFLTCIDPQLTPRGLLLAGEPGTGKTLAAKHIAGSLGIPLYRLDLAGVMDKWQGESERYLSRALAQLDAEAPCVCLIDEAEKVLQASSTGDAGSSTRLLSSLLWWLQEHTSQVLTVMTSNHLDVLPPEIYRPGRIDEVMIMERLAINEAPKLALLVYKSLSAKARRCISQADLLQYVDAALTEKCDSFVAHVTVANLVYMGVKVRLANSVK